MDVIMEGLVGSVKDKVGKCTSSIDLWDKMKSLYMIQEVIKASEDSNEKGESSLSNKNEPSEDEDMLQEYQEEEPPKKEEASNKDQ